MYTFNWDWTHPIKQSLPYLEEYKNRPTSLLEIGIWEACSAILWLTELLVHPKSHYTGIDDWWSQLTSFPADLEPNGQLRQGLLEQTYWYRKVRQHAFDNLNQLSSERWTIIEKSSRKALYDLQLECAKFDIVYIDGGHDFGTCFLDSMLAWPLTNEIMLWDDLHPSWEVSAAIQYFLELIPDEFDVLFYPEQHPQFAIKKRPDVISHLAKSTEWAITKASVAPCCTRHYQHLLAECKRHWATHPLK